MLFGLVMADIRRLSSPDVKGVQMNEMDLNCKNTAKGNSFVL